MLFGLCEAHETQIYYILLLPICKAGYDTDCLYYVNFVCVFCNKLALLMNFNECVLCNMVYCHSFHNGIDIEIL